ncbi:class I SAM-dependent RNA methyltransferase [Candidatus Saccharibacteria bacterium]|nr:class I SAM-dependent RNA methyltransferase [Candidatus Saccharibacteria bacterium]
MPRRRKKFEPKEIILDSPLKIEKLTPTGQGIGTLSDGKKIFLWNTLPNEEVKSFIQIKSKSSYDEGIAKDFVKTSEHRVEPKDEQYLSTSPWQIMTDDYEADQKTAVIKELFRNLWQNDVAFHQSPSTWHYRNKMEYSLYYNFASEKIELAIHPRGSHSKMPIKTSSIERAEIFEKAEAIIKQLNESGDEAKNYSSLLLRCNQNGDVEGGLFEKRKPHPVFNNLTDQILGKTYSYSPNGFFQINLPVYEIALTRIKEILDTVETKKVVDLYSGVGTIGLSTAREKELTLVEVDKSAYKELEANCKDIKTATPVLAKSEEALDYIAPDSVVILDPPRAGCDKALIDKLIEVKPKQIIYLSCNPITQVRDIELLIAAGAKLKSVEAFNFFPHTPHIENLVSLDFA